MSKNATKPAKNAVRFQPESNGVTAPEVMTLAEAAAWLRVAEEGLKADAVAGRIPARQIAGEWRFNKAVLRVWFSESEQSVEKSSKDRMLSAFGAWKEFGEEPEAMIAELKRVRKAMSTKKE